MTRSTNNQRLANIESQLGDLRQEVGEIRGALLGELGLINVVKAHDKEIKELNRAKWQILGGATVIAVLIGQIKSWIFGK